MRRVMHMIREEAQQECAETAEQAGQDRRFDHDADYDHDHEQQPPQPSTPQQAAGGGKKAAPGQGLLSRALRPTLLASRALSLHNLLDQSAVPELRPPLGATIAEEIMQPVSSARSRKCCHAANRYVDLILKEQSHPVSMAWHAPGTCYLLASSNRALSAIALRFPHRPAADGYAGAVYLSDRVVLGNDVAAHRSAIARRYGYSRTPS